MSKEARSAFEVVPPEHGWSPWVWYWQLVYEGKYQEALSYLSSIPREWIRIKVDGKPMVLYQAYVHEALGEPELALAAYETARTLLEAEVNAYPEDPRYRSSLGVAYAALGQTEDAIREGERAVELYPVSADAVYGTPYVIDLAHLYPLLGDYANALIVIEELLSAPSMISVPLLEVDPRWNRLRDVPGFQRLLEEYGAAD